MIKGFQIYLFANQFIQIKLGNDGESRIHWSRSKYQQYPFRYIVKNVPLTMMKVNIKDMKNSVFVTKLFEDSVPGLVSNSFRWKRIWSDNSMKFIESIVLESKTEIKELINKSQWQFKIKIRNRVTNHMVYVQNAGNKTKYNEDQKINNESMKSIFLQQLQNESSTSKVINNQQLNATNKALAAINNLPGQNANDLGGPK